jgi:hypothetical protein
MTRRLLFTVVTMGSAAWATGEGGVKDENSRRTHPGVQALANSSRESSSGVRKAGVAALANVASGNVKEAKKKGSQARDWVTDDSESRQTRQREARRRDRQQYGDQAADAMRGTGAGNRRRPSSNRPTGAYQWGGLAPIGAPWGGFAPNGAYFGRVSGYRSFLYPYGWGNAYSTGYPFFVPNYYGFGFSPVVFGLSGPVTVRYDEPLLRQWKLVDDGVRKLATGSGTHNP